MTFNEYQRGVMRTASDVTKATKENMLMNGILGTAGEAGELVDLLKKQIFQGHPFDREHLIKECGDVLYYLALTAEALDTSLEDIAIKNNKKLCLDSQWFVRIRSRWGYRQMVRHRILIPALLVRFQLALLCH